MAKHKEEKTNVVRILEAAGIPCTAYEVPLEKGQVPDGVTAARRIGKPPEQVFKTLVAEGPKGEHFVFVIHLICKIHNKISLGICEISCICSFCRFNQTVSILHGCFFCNLRFLHWEVCPCCLNHFIHQL